MEDWMRPFELTLITATLLCTLVAGFLFAFAVVVMPGIGALNSRNFLRAFQVIDGVIQNNHPIFVLAWVGSVVALLASAALGLGRLDGVGRLLMGAAVLVYLVGVQLPTIMVNIPLNNAVQALQTDGMDEAALEAARFSFESRWTYWNIIRTALASLVSVLLMILLLRR
jgi:uncharacterized membrane protein